jgi:BMT5-like rRNA (uridine-N3-)-methyltransferase
MALSPFASYQTHHGCLYFFNNDGTVEAQVPGDDKFVPVELPRFYAIEKLSLGQIEMRVIQLLRNVHLQPVYQANRVEFIPSSLKGKIWEKAAERTEYQIQHWVARRDGRISFSQGDTITTWDWAKNVGTQECDGKFKVTALAESEDGVLILGSDEGKLRLGKGEAVDTGTNSAITKIVCLKWNHSFVQFENGESLIVDMTSFKSLEGFDAAASCVVLENEVVVVLDDSELRGFHFDLDAEEYVLTNIPSQRADRIEPLSPTQFMLFSGKTAVSIWEKRGSTVERCYEYPISRDLYTELSSGSCTLDGRTLCVKPIGNMGRQGCYVSFILGGKHRRSDPKGNWEVKSMIPLSDGTVAYTTDIRGAGFHTVDSEGRIQFSADVKEFIGTDEWIGSLIELVDGSIVAKTATKIFVLKSRIDLSRSTEYLAEKEQINLKRRIEDCELEIKYAPNNSAIYTRLAELQKEDAEQRYRTILRQLQAANRTSELYQARRLYRQARRMNPKDPEPCYLFLTFLSHSADQKLARRVQLDLYSITKDKTVLPSQNKFTKRLLIGEGDFSYTEALLKKHEKSHPKLGQAITATEYQTVKNSRRLELLKQKGVKIFEGVDGRKLHEYFKDQRIKRIQWNMPFGASRNDTEFEGVMPQFFESASQLQHKGDRVHVTLMQEDGKQRYRQIENRIVLGATSAQYRLIRKRRFGVERYPGYQHVKTNGEPYQGSDETREFVFEKTEGIRFDDNPLTLQDPKEKEYNIGSTSSDLKDAYFECSTDEESSDYYDSDEATSH